MLSLKEFNSGVFLGVLRRQQMSTRTKRLPKKLLVSVLRQILARQGFAAMMHLTRRCSSTEEELLEQSNFAL